MKKHLCAILAAVAAAALVHAGEAVVSNGCTVCVLPGAYPSSPSASLLAPAAFPTNPAAGDLAVTNKTVVQYTVDGWQPVLRSRKFLSLSLVSVTATNVQVTVRDAAGDLHRLSPSAPSLVLASPFHVPQLPLWLAATNGDAVVFSAHR
jgi:hypothetical protein